MANVELLALPDELLALVAAVLREDRHRGAALRPRPQGGRPEGHLRCPARRPKISENDFRKVREKLENIELEENPF